MMDLAGKVVVITGASRGIGAGLAKECIARGMKVSVCARSVPDVDKGDNILAIAADVVDAAAVQSLADQTIDKFGQIDLWVNNAGVLPPISPLRDCSTSDMLAHLNVNIMGVFHGTKSFVNHVRSRPGEGVLINISSGASTSAYEGWGAYCASKAAVDRLTEVVDLEEKDEGLRAYAIAPGIIDTDMQSLIRGCDETQFPMVEKFRELKRDKAFSSLEFVARELLKAAFDQDNRPETVCVRLPSEND
ncbi:MAG: SDR family NAD(P)-dependent oxidoreductase [Kofleriaceae bacterium]|nr:SDR family NAD(P)-dependent oxidoreductase [Kofleriaceae bacterium]